MGKKLLYCLAATSMLFANVEMNAQGNSCETATPWSGMAMVTTPATYPDGAWYTVTVAEASQLPFSFGTYAGEAIDAVHVYKGCAGEEAIVLDVDNVGKTKSYYLEPATEYKIKVNTANQSMVMMTGTALPMSMAPDGATCMNPIVADLGMFYPIEKETPTWYKVTIPWPCFVSVTKTMTDNTETAVTAVLAKNLDCNAVANESSAIMPGMVKVKAGINLVRVTTSGKTQIVFQPQVAASCGNSPQRTTELKAGAEVSFSNDVFDNYWRFIAPEAATYTLTNKAPEGTILKVGKLEEDDNGKFFCDFETNPRSVTVGSDNVGKLDVTLEKDEQIIICSDLYAKLATGVPSIKVEKSTGSGIVTSATDAPKDLTVSANPSNGNFVVKSYLLAEGATVGIYDMAGKKIYSSTSLPTNEEHTVQLNGVQSGTYLLLVIGKSKSASTKITIE